MRPYINLTDQSTERFHWNKAVSNEDITIIRLINRPEIILETKF